MRFNKYKFKKKEMKYINREKERKIYMYILSI